MLPVTRPGSGTSPRQASAVIDLPLPDSPTSPNTSPLATDRVQPRTACTVRSRPGNSMCRLLISSRSVITAAFRWCPAHAAAAQRRAAGIALRRDGDSTGSVQTRFAPTSVARLMLWVERIRGPHAHQGCGGRREGDRKTGEPDGPPIVDEARARQRGHQPPFGGWRLGADTDEAERGRRQDGIAEVHGALHDDRRERVRQGVPQYDADIPNPHGARRRDV